MRGHRRRRAGAAGCHGHQQVEVPAGDCGMGVLFQGSLLCGLASREQEQEKIR